jgi:hypothetical protein
MKPDGMLIEPEYIVSAQEETAQQGNVKSFAQLKEIEPVLASFIQESLIRISGKIALTGTPASLTQGVHKDTMMVILTCIAAQKKGHYEYWKDSIMTPPKSDLNEKSKSSTKPKRKTSSSRGKKNPS